MHHNNAGDSLLPCSVPFKLRHSFMSANKLVYDTNIVDPFTYGGEDVHTNSVQCFMTKSSPVSTLDWNAAYDNDLSTKLIVSVLKDRHEPNKIPENKFSSVNPAGYKTNLQAGRIQMLNEKLVLYQPVLMDTKIVSLITIVPESLRFATFTLDPAAGIWASTRRYTECIYDSSGPKCFQTSKNGQLAVITVKRIIFGEAERVNCIFRGLSQFHFGSCTWIYGHQGTLQAV